MAHCPIPADDLTLTSLIEAAFSQLTERSLKSGGDFKVERFAHGGMSSGFISSEFWRHQAVTQLHKNRFALGQKESAVASRMAN